MKPSILIYILKGLIAMVFLALIFYMHKRNKEDISNLDFNGKIDSVHYDVKGLPYVLISKRFYYLTANVNFDHKIQKGDTLIKRRGEHRFELKKTNGEVFIFD